MTQIEVIQSISQHYHKLPTQVVEDLETHSSLYFAEKGEKLVREGQYADKTYYIAQGSSRAYYLKDGKDVTDWFAFENEFICPLQSFYFDVPSPHFIEVMEPTHLLVMSKLDIDRLSDQHRAFERLNKIIVTRTMLRLQMRIMSLQFETAKQKYTNLLTQMPDIELRVPLTHIASFLGITIETLSRIRHAEKENLI